MNNNNDNDEFDVEQDTEHEQILNQCALECMQAIETKDKSAFRSAFEVLISDMLHRISKE